MGPNKKYTPYKGKNTKKKYKGITRLKKLDYDPIKELVWLARELGNENQYWKDVRSGNLVDIQENGRERKYSAVAHTGVLALMQKVATDLLPYAYSKVPEDHNMNVSGGGQFNIISGEVDRSDVGIIEHDKDDDIIDAKIVPIMPKKP